MIVDETSADCPNQRTVQRAGQTKKKKAQEKVKKACEINWTRVGMDIESR